LYSAAVICQGRQKKRPPARGLVSMKRVHSAEHGDDSDWTPPTDCERGNSVTSSFVHLFLRFAVRRFCTLFCVWQHICSDYIAMISRRLISRGADSMQKPLVQVPQILRMVSGGIRHTVKVAPVTMKSW